MYKYYNQNPNNDILGDCVCKAISLATGLQYDAVDNLLELTSEIYGCDKLCICCYHNLLEKILCYDRRNCNFNYTVEDISLKFPRDILIVRIEGHLTCICRGNILDIWDCSDELVDCYWIIK